MNIREAWEIIGQRAKGGTPGLRFDELAIGQTLDAICVFLVTQVGISKDNFETVSFGGMEALRSDVVTADEAVVGELYALVSGGHLSLNPGDMVRVVTWLGSNKPKYLLQGNAVFPSTIGQVFCELCPADKVLPKCT